MTAGTELIIHTDGAARGNPGPAAYAYTIAGADGGLIEGAGCLGTMTNNQAEYIALVKALEHARTLGAHHRLRILSDSELLVKQMNGQYQVKDAKLRNYYEKAAELRDEFSQVTIRHIPRAQNSEADRLCNEALDGRRRSSNRDEPASKAPPVHAPSAPALAAPATLSPARDPKIRARVLECLTHAAGIWARGNASDPPPEAVLDEIWGILADRGAGVGECSGG